MERTRSLTSNYYRGSQAIILVYAIDDMYSLTVLRNWIADITKDAQDALKFLVGNKIDLADEGSQVDDQLAESFCKNNGIQKLYRVSAKTGAGVKEMFDDVVKMLISNKESTSGHKKEPYYYGHSWSGTDEVTHCSCSDSDHNRTACRHTSKECPYTAGSPSISIPGRKAKKRKRWSSHSDSSSENKHPSPRESSSEEMSDLEPQFIPKLTNDSMELTEDEQFRNVILQFSESRLEEEVRTVI